jgi:hypothetical protein
MREHHHQLGQLAEPDRDRLSQTERDRPGQA